MTPVKSNNGPLKKFVILMVGIVAVCWIVGKVSDANQPAGTPTVAQRIVAATCTTDWTKCADNREMANNYSGWTRAKTDCKFAANDRAKYGTPEWPWLVFGTFYKGNDYLTGIVMLHEPKAKFQNGFGAMVHTGVTCQYNLRTGQVLGITFEN